MQTDLVSLPLRKSTKADVWTLPPTTPHLLITNRLLGR